MDEELRETQLPLLRDRRQDDELPWHMDPSINISTRLMAERIQAVHCRLLERATGGRLTWKGDQIVRKHPTAGVYQPADPTAVETPPAAPHSAANPSPDPCIV